MFNGQFKNLVDFNLFNWVESRFFPVSNQNHSQCVLTIGWRSRGPAQKQRFTMQSLRRAACKAQIFALPGLLKLTLDDVISRDAMCDSSASEKSPAFAPHPGSDDVD